jgi:hypothetical protein
MAQALKIRKTARGARIPPDHSVHYKLDSLCQACKRRIVPGQTWKFTSKGGRIHYHCAMSQNPAGPTFVQALSLARAAGAKIGDTSGFEPWLVRTKLASRSPLVKSKLKVEFWKGVETGEAPTVKAPTAKKAAPVAIADYQIFKDGEGNLRTQFAPEKTFGTLKDVMAFVDAQKNPSPRFPEVTDRALRYRANTAEGLGRIIGVARRQGWTEVEEAAKAKARKLHIRTAALEKHAASVASQNPESAGTANSPLTWPGKGIAYRDGIGTWWYAPLGTHRWTIAGKTIARQLDAALGEGTLTARQSRNPESAAADLYEEFHGQPPAETLEIVTEKSEHEWLTQLGQLVELKVQTVTNLDATFRFSKEAPELCSSEDGKQLYIEGGDQEIDLKALKMDGEKWVKDSMTIGVLYELTYRTKKGFHKFKTIDYFHKLGEESGVQPYLLYDPRNALLSISGGQYHTKPEGIVN